MNRSISQKFRFYSFLCIAALLFVHGYNLNDGYLQPFSLVNEKLTFTSFIEYFLANCILRFRIPLLFIISGYIYAMMDYKPYGERIKKRFRTLIIPYFIWSAVGLAITFLWQQFPITAEAVRLSQLDQLGENQPYSELGWSAVLFRWVLVPISFQLWFIRSLFIYNLLYPLFRWAITKYPAIWFVLAGLMWIGMFGFLFIEGMGVFFFSLGIWLNKFNFPIDKKPEWYSRYVSWLTFIGLSLIRTFMAFEFEAYETASILAMSLLHAATVLSGILAVWYTGDPVVKWCMNKKWFVWASAFSFTIFALHVPLLQYCMRLTFMLAHNLPMYRLLSYIFVPLAVLSFCIAAGALLRFLAPGVYKIATGGRGF